MAEAAAAAVVSEAYRGASGSGRSKKMSIITVSLFIATSQPLWKSQKK